jgi:SAM-dependent methyltransferase
MICLLCASSDTIIIENISCRLLKRAYKKKGIDIDKLLQCKTMQYVQCSACGIRFFVPPVTGDDVFYRQLQRFSWYYLNDKQEYAYAQKYINGDAKVLEIGAGSGAFARYLNQQNYTGLEFSQDAVDLAQKNGINVFKQDVQSFAKENPEEYDVVCSFQVLEHVSDPASFLSAQIQALKPGGKLVIAVPSEDSFLKYITNGILNMPPHHITRWSDNVLESLTDLFGIQCIDIYHEKLAEIHKKGMISTLLQKCFLKPKLTDNSLKRKIISKFSSLLVGPLSKSMPLEMYPNGHTVVAVYEKK